MITLPNPEDVAGKIVDALDHVNAANRAQHLPVPGWFREIAAQIANRLPDLECCAKEEPEPCRWSEWMFDFCALLYDRAAPRNAHLLIQAVAIGEVEWDPKGIDDDFEKLLVADAMVLFMVFEKGSREEAETELDRLQEIVHRRYEYLRARGIRPPIFLLSCWTYLSQGPFLHRKI